VTPVKVDNAGAHGLDGRQRVGPIFAANEVNYRASHNCRGWHAQELEGGWTDRHYGEIVQFDQPYGQLKLLYGLRKFLIGRDFGSCGSYHGLLPAGALNSSPRLVLESRLH
jgi:hypothetical protein